MTGYVLRVAVVYVRQMCSVCGFAGQKDRNGRVLLSLACQHPAHADRNTTYNIDDAGMHNLGRPARLALCAKHAIHRPRQPEAPMFMGA